MHSGIREHMEVIGSDGGHVGRVDHLVGDDIELAMLDLGSASSTTSSRSRGWTMWWTRRSA